MSHAASAFYPSPFDEAAILVVDGVGEWATTTIAHGKGATITPLREVRFPHSLGFLYSAFTQYCGFKVNSGEYKLMGLAPYGRSRFKSKILEALIDLKADGSFHLDLDYFSYTHSARMLNDEFRRLFKPKSRKADMGGRIGLHEMDLAASIQAVIDEAMLRLSREALRLTGSNNLCLAGGVALNCVTNGKLLRSLEGLESLWIQPAAGDAGGAIGAALHVAHNQFDLPRIASGSTGDGQHGSFLGPDYTPAEIEVALESAGLVYHRIEDREEHAETVAADLARGAIVGRFDGRMEFGPRALGNRSIVADPRGEGAQSHINLKIKNRESWRPFAPAVLAERAADIFELEGESPYMLLVADVKRDLRLPVDWEAFREGDGDLIAFAARPRSTLPAITHVDHSARVQTVDAARNADFHRLVSAFHRRTGCPVLVNTSFNVRGEPIVCTPEDAIRCFLNTGLDLLAIGEFLVWKRDQSDELRSLEGSIAFDPD